MRKKLSRVASLALTLVMLASMLAPVYAAAPAALTDGEQPPVSEPAEADAAGPEEPTAAADEIPVTEEPAEVSPEEDAPEAEDSGEPDNTPEETPAEGAPEAEAPEEPDGAPAEAPEAEVPGEPDGIPEEAPAAEAPEAEIPEASDDTPEEVMAEMPVFATQVYAAQEAALATYQVEQATAGAPLVPLYPSNGSSNIGAQRYSRWAHPVLSYLGQNADGSFDRVECMRRNDGAVLFAERYNASFELISRYPLGIELSIWGGCYLGKTYNFLIFGQSNPDESDSVEVIRVVKYSKNWERLGAVGVFGANTSVPFDAGSLRCTEKDGSLYVRTSHEMYRSSDGYNHQASMTVVVNEETLQATATEYVGGGTYVSHSFNQFILTDSANRVVMVDHGDAYPRALKLTVMLTDNPSGRTQSGTVLSIPGDIGNNTTGTTLGGLAETTNGYVTAFSYNGVGTTGGSQQIYLGYTDKATMTTKTTKLTTSGAWPTPTLVPTGLGGGYILWNGTDADADTLYYAKYSDGGTVGAVQKTKAPLSDCQPVYVNGKVIWYTDDRTGVVFYELDDTGAREAARRGGWTLSADGTLTLQGGVMRHWAYEYYVPWYSVRDQVKRVVFEGAPEGTIENFAFLRCTQLEEIRFPEGVTAIGNSAFNDCSSLKGNLTIPKSVTEIGVGAFSGCSALTGVTIPAGVTGIKDQTFSDCSGLESVTIPAGVKEIGDNAFSRCSSLKSIAIPSSVTSIGSAAFNMCSNLAQVTIANGVKSIGPDAFYSCRSLTDVTIPGSVTSLGEGAFAWCDSLKSVTIPEGITSLENTFNSCSALESVTIPSSVTSISGVTFSWCQNLKKILFKGNAPTIDSQAFYVVTATAYYPRDNATWTEAVRQNYGGTLTWVPYDPANPPSMDSETPVDPADTEDPTELTKPGTPNTWRNTKSGWQYLGADGKPLKGSNWINALGHRYVFDDNGILQTGNADGDLLWEGNQYYLNPDRDPNDPSTCYCVINYTRRRDAGVTYYNQDGITYRGWVDGGNGKLLYQTVLRDENGKEKKDEAGFSTYIYVWGGQQIPEGRDPLDAKKTIPAGNYLFGEDGVLVTGKTGWYTIPGSSAIAGEYYLTDANGHCALNTTRWDNAKGHRYLFGADGRKVSAGKDGRDVALTINGEYQTVYLAPNTDYVACNYYRPRKDSKGGDLGLTYYNPDGITYRGWVDGGSGKRLYQTVMDIEGVGELYFIVWHAQYLPAGKDPVTKDPIPAGWYLFDDNGVLITKDGVYTAPDTKGVNHRYQVKGGKIVAIDGKAPTPPKGA